jgi:hypothetical protein
MYINIYMSFVVHCKGRLDCNEKLEKITEDEIRGNDIISVKVEVTT